MAWWDEVRFGPDGLVPVVVQDAGDSAVLMLGWADAEALRRTAAERRAWFWSRSRGRLWRKGETSGHGLEVTAIRYDCDADAVLYRVRAEGPTCHTGRRSCFHRGERGEEVAEQGTAAALGPALAALAEVIRDRQARRPEGSYVAALLDAGRARVAQKVGEEAVEVAVAALAEDRARQVAELADLLFHTLVLMADLGVSGDEVGAELRRRAR